MEVTTCHLCGGELTVMGALGSKVWFRCIACGADQHAEDPGQALGFLEDFIDYEEAH